MSSDNDRNSLLHQDARPTMGEAVAAPTGFGNTPGDDAVAPLGLPIILGDVTSRIGCDEKCWYCSGDNSNGELFLPCQCPSPIHRTCFRKWRQGWINPRNYFCCPTCMSTYRLERVKPEGDSKERIVRRYRCQVAKLWLGVLLLVVLFVGGIGGIAYGCDTSEKNVPIAVKFAMTSVIQGWPPANATTIWREQFKQPGTPVWPYYTLLGAFISSLLVLFAFCLVGCTFDEHERKRRPCCEQCGDCGNRDNACCIYCYCYDPCPGGCHCAGGGGGCGNCSGGDCKLDGGGEAVIIIIIIVVVVVILSAVFVVILYCIKKGALFHDRMTDMLYCQQSELESETIVLGRGESIRPLDQV